MPTLTATLNLDITAIQTKWTTAKQTAAGLSAKIQAVQAKFPEITVAGAPGSPGVLTFTVDDSTTQAALADLLAAVTALRDGILTIQGDLDALTPTVTAVS